MRQLHWFFKVALTILLLLFLFVIFNFILPAVLPTKIVDNGEVYGFQLQNQIWQGTVRVTGDLITPIGTTVTIKPGTNVLVSIGKDKSNFNFLPWQLKTGINTKSYYHGVNAGEPFWDEGEKIQVHISRLRAEGTKEQPIIIRSDSNNGSPYDINSIWINNGILSNALISDYRRLEIGSDVTIRDSSIKNVGECGICMSSGKPSVINNTFEKIFREAIWVERASPRITDNLFINLSGSGIRIDSKRFSSPVISHNSFEMHKYYAIDILSGGELNEGLISFNKFAGGSIIKIACDSNLKIAQNIILSSIAFTGSGCGGSFIFGPNYFGTPDSRTVLSEKIIQKDRNFSIKIPTVLISPPREAGRR